MGRGREVGTGVCAMNIWETEQGGYLQETMTGGPYANHVVALAVYVIQYAMINKFRNEPKTRNI